MSPSSCANPPQTARVGATLQYTAVTVRIMLGPPKSYPLLGTSLEAELVEEVLDTGGLLLGLDVLLVQVPLLEDLPHGLLDVGGGGLDGRLVDDLLEVDVHLVTAPS